MRQLNNAIKLLVQGLGMAILVAQGACLGVLLARPQPLRDIDPSWKSHVVFVGGMIILTVVSLLRLLDFRRPSKPPQQSDF